MKILRTTLTAFALLSSSSAFAAEQCPDYLPTNLMMDCIVETGAADRSYETEITGGEYDAVVAYKEWREVQAQRIDALDKYTGSTASTVKHKIVKK